MASGSFARRFWDTTAWLYVPLRTWGPFGWIRWLELYRTRKLLNSAPRGGVWLDLGCGDGRILSLHGWTGLRVGVDWSRRMARMAKERADAGVVADVRELPLTDGSASLITLLGVTEYVGAAEQLWSEVARVLRPGGWALVTVCPPTVLNRLRRALGKRLFLRSYEQERIYWGRHGLQIVETERTLLQILAVLQKTDERPPRGVGG